MRPGRLGDGGRPAPDEDVAPAHLPGWGNPAPVGAAAPRIQPASPARWRYRVLLAGLTAALAGLAVSMAGVAGQLLPR